MTHFDIQFWKMSPVEHLLLNIATYVAIYLCGFHASKNNQMKKVYVAQTECVLTQ